MQEQSIAAEKQLVGQSTYLLNRSGSKWIIVGLSPAAGFVPIIQIRSHTSCIFFTTEEWSEFCRKEGNSPNHEIEASTYRDISIIRLKSRHHEIVLSTETYNNLFNLQPVINKKINLLVNVDFVAFYKSVLNSCIKLEGDLYTNILTLLSAYTNSYNALYLLETLHICFNTVSYDFEVMKIGEN